LITILDFASYVAVKRNLAKKTISKINNEKLKKVKVRVAEAS